VGQINGHSNPDHIIRRADIEWDSLASHAILLIPQWPHRVCDGSAWLDRLSKKPSVKVDLFIYRNCVTVSGQYLSVAIIINNKMDFNSCAYMATFPKSSHIFIATRHCYDIAA